MESVKETNPCRLFFQKELLYRETKSAEAPPTPKFVMVLKLVQFFTYSNTCSHSLNDKYLALETVYKFQKKIQIFLIETCICLNPHFTCENVSCLQLLLCVVAFPLKSTAMAQDVDTRQLVVPWISWLQHNTLPLKFKTQPQNTA